MDVARHCHDVNGCIGVGECEASGEQRGVGQREALCGGPPDEKHAQNALYSGHSQADPAQRPATSLGASTQRQTPPEKHRASNKEAAS